MDKKPTYEELENKIKRLEHKVSILEKRNKLFAGKSEMFNKLLSTVPDIIIRTNLDGKIIFINEIGQRLGYYNDITEIVGKNILAFIAPEDYERAAQNTRNMMIKHLTPREYRLEMNNKSLYVEINGDVLRRADETPFGLIFVIRDISARKKTEQALIESETKFREVWENLLDQIIIIEVTPDHRFKILGFNPAEEKLLGINSVNVIGTYIDDLLPAESVKKRIKNYLKCVEHKTAINYEEKIFRNDEKMHFSSTLVPIFDSNGNVNKIIGISRNITNRRLVEEALIESEEKYRRLIDILPEGIAIISEGKIIFVNEMAVKILQCSKVNELIGKNFYEIVNPEDQLNIINYISENQPSSKPALQIETRFLTFNNKTIDVEISSLPIQYIFRSSILLVFRDITNRKRMLDELVQSEERFRNLFENMTDGFILLEEVVDENNKIIDLKVVKCNSSAAKMFNYNQDKTIGLSINQFNPEANEKLISAFSKVLKTGIPRRYESYSASFNKYFKTIVYCHENNRAAVLFEDISARKKYEFTLKESEEKYRMLIENIEEGIAVVDTSENITFANRSAAVLFGVEESLVGKNLKSFVEPVQYENLLQQSKLRHDGITSVYELDIIRFNGERRTVLVTGSPKLDNGEWVGTFGIFRDITQLKNAQIQLEKQASQLIELNATKDKFFTIIAHDLKNPFNTILGFLDVLQDYITTRNFEEIERAVGFINSASKHAFELLENLLAWSRSQTGAIEFNPVQLDILEIINRNIEEVESIAQKKEIQIIFFDDFTNLIYADKNMLNTILRNLLTNAIKFSNCGGIIEVRSNKDDSFCFISVKDHGVGIEQKSIDKLFRIDSKRTTYGTAREKGTGLGLLICKEFVEKHGGSIRVNSELYKGSEFIFKLPIH